MILKKFFGIFGGEGDAGERPESPASSEKRLHSRLDVGDAPALTVALDVAGGTRAQVVNVSARGLRLRLSGAARSALSVGQDLTGTLLLDDAEIRMNLRVIRLIGDAEAGFRIRPPFPKELERLERFLEPRFLGRSLREIDPAKLQRDAGDRRTMRWFQGLNDTNLFSWEDGGAVAQLQLVFLERVVEWSAASGTRTGRIRGEGATLPGWVKADLLEFDAAADAEVLHEARVLLENAEVAPKIKETFLSKIYVR